MTPVFRWTLNSAALGPLRISDPIGWKMGEMILERSEDYHEVVEYYNGDFTFYGSDGVRNGGLDYLLELLSVAGVNAHCTLTSELSLDYGSTYDTLFVSKLDFSLKEFVISKKSRKMKVPSIRSDFWTKIKNRDGVSVDLKSTKSIEGTTLSALAHETFNMPSQTVKKRYDGYLALSVWANITGDVDDEFIQVDVDTDVIAEYDKYHLPISNNAIRPGWIFEMEAGVHTWDIVVSAKADILSGNNAHYYIEFYIQTNNDTPTLMTATEFGVYSCKWDYSGTVTYAAGDVVRIYAQQQGSDRAPIRIIGKDEEFPPYTPATYFKLTGATKYIDTTAQGFYQHDVFAAVLERITDTANIFKSDVMGGTFTNKGSYGADGKDSRYAVIWGAQMRGYTLTERSAFTSFRDIWQASDSVFCWGLGYENGKAVIRDRADFYDSTLAPLTFNNVDQFMFKYMPERFYKAIKIGYLDWKAESSGGITDPQTVRKYSTMFSAFGQEISILSGYVAAAVAIERTRRKTKDKSEDDKFDDRMFLIALGADNISPELDENFTGITGLEYPETAYNLRRTAARNMLRFLAFLGACLAEYPSEELQFSGGEGNYKMTSTLDDGSSESDGGDGLAEDQNMEQVDGLFFPEVFSVNYNISWQQYKTMRDNKRKTFRFSQSTTDHQGGLIQKVTYKIKNGRMSGDFIKNSL